MATHRHYPRKSVLMDIESFIEPIDLVIEALLDFEGLDAFTCNSYTFGRMVRTAEKVLERLDNEGFSVVRLP